MTSQKLVKIQVEEDEKYIRLNFELTKNIYPTQLPEIINEFPDVQGRKILLLSGRGPIWLYCALIHKYAHLVSAVATYDPKIGGYVVVSSHALDVDVGEIILA
ncbi:CRISPR-associated protein Csx3 [Thermococci archaeon]|nr:MAG: CRISPR-associated protein Csx3 [Thermococci archaeon]